MWGRYFCSGGWCDTPAESLGMFQIFGTAGPKDLPSLLYMESCRCLWLNIRVASTRNRIFSNNEEIFIKYSKISKINILLKVICDYF